MTNLNLSGQEYTVATPENPEAGRISRENYGSIDVAPENRGVTLQENNAQITTEPRFTPAGQTPVALGQSNTQPAENALPQTAQVQTQITNPAYGFGYEALIKETTKGAVKRGFYWSTAMRLATETN